MNGRLAGWFVQRDHHRRATVGQRRTRGGWSGFGVANVVNGPNAQFIRAGRQHGNGAKVGRDVCGGGQWQPLGGGGLAFGIVHQRRRVEVGAAQPVVAVGDESKVQLTGHRRRFGVERRQRGGRVQHDANGIGRGGHIARQVHRCARHQVRSFGRPDGDCS